MLPAVRPTGGGNFMQDNVPPVLERTEVTSDESTPVKKGVGARFLTLGLSLFLALLVAEVALRILVPARTTHAIWPPGTRQVFRPEQDIFPDLPAEAVFSANSRGLRGPEMGVDGSEWRLLAIGGSTTECLYHDDKKMWPARVGELLQVDGGKKVWVGNAGRSGASSGDHVLQTKYLLKELPPVDLAVMLVGVNDVVVALGAPNDYKPTPADLPPEEHEKAIRKAFHHVPGRLEDQWDHGSFLRQSAIFQLVRRIRRQRERTLDAHNLRQEDAGTTLVRWRGYRQKASQILTELPDLKEALSTYRKNLETTVDLAAASKVQIVLLTQPTFWRDDLTEAEQKLLWMGGVGNFQKEPGHAYYSAGALAKAMAAFNETLLAVCKDKGLVCVDLAAEIPKTTEYFYDDCHFGQRGAEKIAAVVASHLKGVLPFGTR
ncbi:MAG: SGNH/GDSL hydrolase family protein [Polyangiaceae bacterium]|nr:SGNH/GDSL hydrolase family protein [Polyangiaceae bacterium]